MTCVREPGTGPDDTNGTWSNWSQQVTVSPKHGFTPSSIDELVAIVKAAEADGDNGARVRAIGSAWSFTNIIDTPDYLVVMSQLSNVLSETMSSNRNLPNRPKPPPSYTDPVFGAFSTEARAKTLVHVQAGISIRDLYHWLDEYKKNNIGPGTTDGNGNMYGWAVPTLGGSGGQTVVGAISTSTHGGDIREPPLPDMVRAIYLVGPGGLEWWIEPGDSQSWHVVDPNVVATMVPCVAGRVIFNDDLFNSVLVSCGRMGIIYSIVIEVKPQFFLNETRTPHTWNQLRSSGDLERLQKGNNTFLQVLILPYDNGNNDHDCYVTEREPILPEAYKGPKGASGTSIFQYACEHPDLTQVLGAFVTALGLQALSLLAIPYIGWLLYAPIGAILTSVGLIITFGGSLGQALGALVDGVAAVDFLDFTGLAETAINGVLAGAQSSEYDREDISYTIMDTYDYHANCYKAISMEVAFNAADNEYINYIDAVFGIINGLKGSRQMVGAYISLRYCGRSRAFLAIEQWERTVCIEIAGLKDLQNDSLALSKFEAEAAGRGATVHWGQINNRNFNDTQRTYPQIQLWRGSLKYIIGDGSARTFDNDFCNQRGLEVNTPLDIISGKVVLGDTSDGTPTLAAHNGLLFLGWKGSGNPALNVEFSSDSGQHFAGKYISGETTDAPPAMVAHNGILFIAWKGSGNDALNVGQVGLVSDTNNVVRIEGIVNKVTLSDTSDTTPALASHNGVLFIAWKGSGNSAFSIEFSSDGGQHFGNKFISGETTDNAPALVSHNGALIIAWRGSGNDNLNVAQIDLLVNTNNVVTAIRGLRDKVSVANNTSSSGPSLASVGHLLYLGWKGSGNENLNVIVSQDNGQTFVHIAIPNETSDDSPSLAWFNSRCFISWKGSGNDNINVGRVTLNGNLNNLLLETHSGRLVQSSMGIPGDFHTAFLEANPAGGTRLTHFFRDNSDLRQPWQRGLVISNNATSSGSLIQSTLGVPEFPGRFEAVVLEGQNLVHYSHDNSVASNQWQPELVIYDQAGGPGSIIQSSIGTPEHPGCFEVVAPDLQNNLVHFHLDNSNPSSGWQRIQVISPDVTGPGSILQSNFGIDGNLDVPGDFEVVVLKAGNLVHYRHDNSDINLPWQQKLVISDKATGPGAILQSTFGTSLNFEVVVLEGRNLFHYSLDNSSSSSTWQPKLVISPDATGPGSIIQSNFGLPIFPGDFEVLALVGQNIEHYRLDNSSATSSWSKVDTVYTAVIA